jgi:hypothetical protein
MSYYDVECKGVFFRLEIGGDWNRKFWGDTDKKERAQAVVPVWTACEEFMKRLMSLPGNPHVVDRSLRVIVDKKTIATTFAGCPRMKGFWLSCGDERLMFTWADGQPAFVKASSSRWVAWFMNHREDLEDALLASDTDEDSLDKISDDPRYLIRVGRRSREIEDGELDRITIKEVL